MDKSTLTKITNLPTHAIFTFLSILVSGILLGMAYQYIVFEYTSEDGIKKFHELWKYIIVIISGLALISSIMAIYHSVKSKDYFTGGMSFVFMLPVLILLTFVIHSETSKSNERYYSFAREFSHIYSGACLILIVFYIVLTIIGTLYLSLKKLKK